jgi:DNA-binding NtrC family response regulator
MGNKAIMKNAERIRVLVLEDDDIVRLIVKEYLVVSGFEVEESAGPINALKILENNVFHIAIVDIHIPEMSGEAFIEKAQKILPNIQFIIHTGASDYKLSSKLEKMGVSQDSIIVKPVEDMNIFPTLIKQLVQNI